MAEQLKAALTDWRTVASPVKAVQVATSLVRRFRRLMEQAGWTCIFSELEERSPSWVKYGSILAESIRTRRSLGKPEDAIVRGLVSEAETMTPTAPISLSSNFTTITTTTESEKVAAAHSRLKDLEAKSALAKKTSPGPVPAPSGTKAGKTPAHAAAVAKPGPAPVPGLDGATL